jgi:capsular polysaccharide biosynthesis protein
MAVQFESQGQLQEFLGILRKRSWQVILPAAFVIALGVAFAVIVPKKYLVSTQLELRATENSNLIQEVRASQMQLRAIERIRKVVENLKWVDYLALKKEYQPEYLQEIQDQIRVTTTRSGDETAFVTIEYKHVNPRRAHDFLKALRDAWIKDVIDRGRNQLLSEEQKLLDRKNELQREYYREEEGLTDLKRNHEISATQPVPGSRQQVNEDPAFQRHQEKKDQLEDTQLSLKTLAVQIERSREELVDVPKMVSREELIKGRTFDKELVQLERRIAEKKTELDGIRPAHSQYPIIEREISDLEEERRLLLGGQTAQQVRTELVINPEHGRLDRAILALVTRQEVLEEKERGLETALQLSGRLMSELQEVYGEIRTRNQKIDLLSTTIKDNKLSYERVLNKLGRMAGPGGNPFEITSEVAVPLKPTEPNPFLIIAFALVGGLAIGIGSAVIGEFSKSCFRSVNDISRIIIAPVLGSVNTIVTRRDLRSRSARRFLVGTASMAVLGGLVFLTWAWAFKPDLLPSDIRNVIEDLRSALS